MHVGGAPAVALVAAREAAQLVDDLLGAPGPLLAVVQQPGQIGDGKIEFPYLKPDKYKLRLIMDQNKNGKWDTGFLADHLQPEKVIYWPKVIKVRSNFEYKENWKIDYKPDYKKDLVDEELEKEKARKKEQAKKEAAKKGL